MAFAVRGLSKSYGGVEVLRQVDLEVPDGEIHALLGANGAGKSTLIKCLSGAIAPDGGTIDVDGRRSSALTPRGAKLAGISVIYQDLSVAMSLNVADNIFLGNELRRGPFVRRRSQRTEAARWLRELQVDADPGDRLSSLPMATLQAVEIIKSLRSDPKLLILDEPTAALSEREAQALGEYLLLLKRKRLPILYVTHRLSEVYALADRVTVLRGGATVLTGAVSNIPPAKMMEAIVGQRVETARSAPTHARAKAPAVLQASRLLGPGIGPIDIDLVPGEIVGVFGLVGSGRTELLETLFGARRLYGGTIALDGRPLTGLSPPRAAQAGIALVPSDRLRKSIFSPLPAIDNVMLPNLSATSMRGLVRRRSRERTLFDRAAAQLMLRPPKADLEARRFSGGNQQKLVVARWLNDTQSCRVLMLDEPTQGVDVGARRDLYEALRANAAQGCAIVMTSSEPQELVQVAHRVLVLSRGKCVGIVPADQMDEVRLIELAHSVEPKMEPV